MPIIPLKFTTGSKEVRSKNSSSEKLVNMFIEKSSEEEDIPDTLYGSVGAKDFATLPELPVFGMTFHNNYIYAVGNNKIFKVDEAGNSTQLTGFLSSISSPIQLETNGVSVGILDNNGALYNATDTDVTQVLSGNYFDSDSMTILDGFAIFGKSNSTTFFISEIDDFTNFPGDAEIARKTPTPIVRVFSDLGELWTYKQDVTQVYRNTGNADFPFQLLTGSVLQRGCAAKLSVANDSNTKFWLGDDKLFYMAFGYAPKIISNNYVAEQVRAMTVVSDAFGFTYTVGKHKFYVCTFPTEGRTFEYDVVTNEWCDRESYNLGRWRANCYVRAWNGRQFIGDSESGKILELDLDTYKEGNQPIVRTIITPNISNPTVPVTFMSLWIDFETGVGLTSGQGADPEVRLSWSDDGGETWSNQYTRTLGAIGQREKRVVWRGLGQSRNRCFKLEMSDPVFWAISGAFVEVEEGDE